MKLAVFSEKTTKRNWLGRWLLGLVLGLAAPWLAYGQAVVPFTVQVTPAGPLSLPAGSSQTLTANADYSTLNIGTGFDGPVNALALQPDGKIVVGGAFSAYNGAARNNLVRLNPDGSLDASFVVGSDLNGPVNAVLLQPDGRIVVGGSFSTYNGAPRNNLVRLNADGSVDASFRQIGTGFSGPVNALALQPDGQLVVGGNFTRYNGTARTYLARLNTIGNLEATLVPSLPSPVLALALQDDGKILAGGNYLVRLTSKGSLDTSYANKGGVVGDIHPVASYYTSLVLQSDGKLVVGAYTTYLSGFRGGFVQRLDLAGNVEFTYSPNTNTQTGNTVVALQYGEILVGSSSFLGAGVVTYLYRLTPEGNPEGAQGGDPEGALGGSSVTGDLAPINAIVVQPNGQIIIGGAFTNYNGTTQNRLARLTSYGSLNTTPTPVGNATYVWSNGATGPSINVSLSGTYSVTATVNGQSATSNTVVVTVAPAAPFVVQVTPTGPLSLPAGFSQTLTASVAYPTLNIGAGFDGPVNALALQPDGKIVVGGAFSAYNGVAHNNLVRLNPDGSLDASFAVGAGPNGPVNAVLVQPDGRIVVGGSFSTYQGAARSNLVRLNADGSVDASFRQTGSGLNDAVKALALQPDGQLVVGGNFTSYNGTARTYLARLNTIGNLEATLVPSLPYPPVLALALQADGKILVGTLGLVRLNYNGSLDTSYANKGGISGDIHSVASYYASLVLQPDGKLLVGGYVAYLIGSRAGFVQRLDTQGKEEFYYGINNTQAGTLAVALQPDGRILVGAGSYSVDRVATTLVRLTAAGTLEASLGGSSTYFDLAPIEAIAVQPNGQIIIGGAFTNYNGVMQNRLARLNADGSLSTTPAAGASYVWSTGATGPSITVTEWGYYSVTATLNGQSATSSQVLIRPAANSLTVYAANEDLAPSTSAIQVQLQVRNEGTTAIDYQDLTVRYWYTADGAPAHVLPVAYAKLGASNFTVQTGQQNGQSYAELHFAARLGVFAPAGNTGEIQLRIQRADGSDLTQTNDYSFRPLATLAEQPRITAYLAGKLVYGTEPTAPLAFATQALNTPAALANQLAGSPNPGTDQVLLRFSLAQAEAYTLAVYDMQGRLVEKLAGGTGSAGQVQQVQWQVKDYAAGLYLVRLHTPTARQQLKFVKQ